MATEERGLMERIGDLSLLMRLLQQHVSDAEVADLSDRQILILETLSRSDGQLETVEIGSTIGHPSKSALSAVVSDLENVKGLVETRRSEEDHRKRVVKLTKKGWQTLKLRQQQGLKTYAPLAEVVRKAEGDPNTRKVLGRVLDEAVNAIDQRLQKLKNQRPPQS